MRTKTIRIAAQLVARLLHNLISLTVRILRNDTDVRGYNVGFKLLCKVEYSLRLFDKLGVALRTEKSLSEVSAKCRKAKSVILYKRKKLFRLSSG